MTDILRQPRDLSPSVVGGLSFDPPLKGNEYLIAQVAYGTDPLRLSDEPLDPDQLWAKFGTLHDSHDGHIAPVAHTDPVTAKDHAEGAESTLSTVEMLDRAEKVIWAASKIAKLTGQEIRNLIGHGSPIQDMARRLLALSDGTIG